MSYNMYVTLIYCLYLTFHFADNRKHSKIVILIHKNPSINNRIQQTRSLYPLWQISYALDNMIIES